MFQGSKGKTMKWGSLLKDIKEKVGLAQSSTPTSTATTVSSSSSSSSSNRDANASSTRYDFAFSPSRFDLLFSLFSYFQKFILIYFICLHFRQLMMIKFMR